jgi:uncharacterized membrane protein
MNRIQNDNGHHLKKPLQIGLLLIAIAYPAILHTGVIKDNLYPAAMMLLLALVLWGGLELMKRRLIGWFLILVSILGSVWLLMEQPNTIKLLQLPPIFINGAMFLLFSMTLFPSQTPLITRFAQMLHENKQPLNEDESHYTRMVTLFWSGMFAFLTIESVLLASLASREIWSLFTNLINYMLVFVAMIVEYRVRVWRLPNVEHPGFLKFVQMVRRIEWRSLL